MSPEFPVQMPCLSFSSLLGSEYISSQAWQKEQSWLWSWAWAGVPRPHSTLSLVLNPMSDFSGQLERLTSDHLSILETCFEGSRLAAAHLPVLPPASGTGLNFLMNDSLHHHPSCPGPICVREPPPPHKLREC